jgi:hypothetical protein
VKVTVEDAGNGTVAVAIDGAGRLAEGRALLFGIAAAGDDYLVVLRAAGAVLGKWDGASWAPFPHRALVPRARNDTFTFSLAFDDIGATSFDYWATAVRGGNVESAPDTGRFTSLRS